MKVRVYTSSKARISAGLEPVQGQEYVEMDLTKLTQAQREALVATGQEGLGRNDGQTIYLGCAVATQETVARRLEEKAQEATEQKAEKAEALEKAVQRLLAMPQEGLNLLHISSYDAEYDALKDPRLAEKTAIRNKHFKLEAEQKALKDALYEKSHAEFLANQEAETKLARDIYEAERATWIADNGSERLKLCLAGDYSCNRLYLEERVLVELGEGWIVDMKKKAEVANRVAPTLKALKFVEALPTGFTGEVIWMTVPPWKVDYDDEPFEPQEAIRVYKTPFSDVEFYKLNY